MINLLEGFLQILIAVLLAVWATGFAMSSAALYTTAKRRGIRCPYLAWFPVVRQCIRGALVDQYLYVTRGRGRPYRVLLPIADLLWRLLASFLLLAAYSLVTEQASPDRFLSVLGMLLVFPVFQFLGQTISRYWLLRSCAGKNGLMAFLLATLIPMAEPAMLLWFCREDKGMPPRRREET